MEDESTAEAHSVWILVSRFLLLHHDSGDMTWFASPRLIGFTSRNPMRNHSLKK